MATEPIRISGTIPASPQAIFEAWLDAEVHSQFTGDRATCEPYVGGRFTAFNGYVEGQILELEPGRKIVQAWRNSEFLPDQPDSRLEVEFESIDHGTRVTIVHSELPAEQANLCEAGWRSYYLEPLVTYFQEASAEEQLVEVGRLIMSQPVEEALTTGEAPSVEWTLPSEVVQRPAPKRRAGPKAAKKAAAKKAVAKRPPVKKAAKKAGKKAAGKRAAAASKKRPAASRKGSKKRPVKQPSKKRATPKKQAKRSGKKVQKKSAVKGRPKSTKSTAKGRRKR